MKSGKKSKIVVSGFLILALPVLAYAITRLVVYYTPMENDAAMLVACLITALLILSVPYFMLKLLFHNAHMDSGERELKLKDLPDHAQKNFIKKPANAVASDQQLTKIFISAVAIPVVTALAQRMIKRL